MNPEETKRCSLCNKDLPISSFYLDYSGREQRSSRCKPCDTEYARSRRNRAGTQTPLPEAKNIGAYLGVYIAERLLGNVFKTTVRMPYGNPGYDFICGKGFKVDVKASCRIHRIHRMDRWKFNIKKNQIADYFACFALDNRKNLNPEHFWLIPAGKINRKAAITVLEGHIPNWNAYEQPLGTVLKECSALKAVL